MRAKDLPFMAHYSPTSIDSIISTQQRHKDAHQCLSFSLDKHLHFQPYTVR